MPEDERAKAERSPRMDALVRDFRDGTAEVLRGVAAASEQASANVQTVAASAREQPAATREIGRAVAEAAAGTQDVSRHTAGVTEGAERTGAAADQLRAASGELSEQAELLRSRMDRFLGEIRRA